MSAPVTTGLPAIDFDGLTPAERDALPFGLVGLDASGVVTHYNAAQAKLSGIPAARAIGRDFFRQVEPATNLPHFAGRFLEGQRRGHLDETFPFVFSAEPQPVRTEVTMRAGATPGHAWLAVTEVGRLAARGERAAQLAVGRRSRAEPVDPSICEREPIHVPGAVQPHAVILAADLERLTISVCSANAAEVLGLDPARVMGATLDDILPARFVALLRAGIASGTLDAVRQIRRTLRLPVPEAATGRPPAEPRPFLAHAHAHDGRLIIELELAPAHPDDFLEASHLDTEDAVARLRETSSLVEAAALAAREVRGFTGFESVLVYRFDADWNGEAVAEDKVADWDRSLLGLRFPASDIPAQARALYTKAKSRFVIDRDYVPVPLTAAPQSSNAPVDLTYAQARSLSPIHLEYQRNLGVNGSMSISILVEGRLWGLMIGHHRRPHYVAPETRAAATVLTEALALRLSELESNRLWRERQAHLATEAALLRQMAEADDFVAALTRGPTTILDLFGATGAATISQGVVTALGRTPPDDALLALADWMRHRIAPDAVGFATHELPALYGPAWTHGEVASGVVAAFIDAYRENLILWLRPEEASTVTWGGDPRKAVVTEGGGGIVLPRRSFERWIEERRGASASFAEWQVGIAEALATAVDGVMLRQSRKIAELTALLADKERLLAQKDLLTREIDHRVKNSLQIVSAFLQMQRRQAKDPEVREAFADTAARVMSVARVHDSLYQAESVEEVDLGQTIETLCSDLAAMTGGGHALDLKADAGLMVPYRKAVALSLIATELVTNAFKYAYAPGEGGRVEVTVRRESAGRVQLSVSDEGRGLPANWQQSAAQGTGLGMKLVRAMLDQINARLEVAEGAGARFTVHA